MFLQSACLSVTCSLAYRRESQGVLPQECYRNVVLRGKTEALWYQLGKVAVMQNSCCAKQCRNHLDLCDGNEAEVEIERSIFKCMYKHELCPLM